MTTYFGLIIAILFMAISGCALSASLIQTRRVRVSMDRRVGLLVRDERPRNRAESVWQARSAQLDSQVRRFFAFRLPARWGMKSGGVALLTIGLASIVATVVNLKIWLGLSSVLVFPLALFAFFTAPRLCLRLEQQRAETQFTTLFPDAVDMIVRMLRAGLPVTVAIRVVANEASHPIDVVFTALTNQIAIGMDFDEALALASRRIGVADFSFFAAAVALQRSTGGNLAATLEMLAQIIRRRRVARLKARAATGEVRLSAMVLGAMPFVVTGLLLLLNPHYLSPLIADPRGKIIIAVAIILLLLGFVSMHRLMRTTETL
jgi:tight adherence protein B